MQRFILAHDSARCSGNDKPRLGMKAAGRFSKVDSGTDGHKATAVGGCGDLHGSNFLLGGKAALYAGANLGVGLAALVANGLLKGAALALLPIPV